MNHETRLQIDLLLAAFAEPALALPAWQRWQARSGWESAVDFDAYLLLSRVFHNLGGSGVDDTLFRLLRGVVKRNWAANAPRLASIARIAGTLQELGVSPVLLPPASELLADRSTPLEDDAPLAMLIERIQARHVARHLLDTGWRTAGGGVPRWCLPGYIAATEVLQLRHRDGTALALYWQAAPGSGEASEWHQLKGRAFACAPPLASVRFLLAEEHPGAGFRRLARALLVLARTTDIESWRYLQQTLQQQSSPFSTVVDMLAPPGPPPGAPSVLFQATQGSNPVAQASGDRSAGFAAQVILLWQRYRDTLGQPVGTLDALRWLPGYLVGKWGLPGLGELPPRVASSLRYHWRHGATRASAKGRGRAGAPTSTGKPE